MKTVVNHIALETNMVKTPVSDTFDNNVDETPKPLVCCLKA